MTTNNTTRTRTRKPPAAPAAPVAAPVAAKPPTKIMVGKLGLGLLVRAANLALAFGSLRNQYETRAKVVKIMQDIGQADERELDTSDYNVSHHVLEPLRLLVSSGALSDAELQDAAKIEADYAATRPWDKRGPVEPSAEWRLRVWLIDHGYAAHVSGDSHSCGLPPGSVALVNRWRSEIDGRHVLAIYPDCVREATLPYNHGHWHVSSQRRYSSPEDLDAILRPWVTAPATTWDAKPKATGRTIHVGAATADALLRAVSIRDDASDEQARLVREFLTLVGGVK